MAVIRNSKTYVVPIEVAQLICTYHPGSKLSLLGKKWELRYPYFTVYESWIEEFFQPFYQRSVWLGLLDGLDAAYVHKDESIFIASDSPILYATVPIPPRIQVEMTEFIKEYKMTVSEVFIACAETVLHGLGG